MFGKESNNSAEPRMLSIKLYKVSLMSPPNSNSANLILLLETPHSPSSPKISLLVNADLLHLRDQHL